MTPLDYQRAGPMNSRWPTVVAWTGRLAPIGFAAAVVATIWLGMQGVLPRHLVCCRFGDEFVAATWLVGFASVAAWIHGACSGRIAARGLFAAGAVFSICVTAGTLGLLVGFSS